MAIQGFYSILASALLLCNQALAADDPAIEMYRYTNEKGVTVIDRLGVPPQFVGKGYEVINQYGRVIRVVPPAPTAEEIAQHKANALRAKSDARLLRIYSSVEDVDLAKERKLRELDDLTGITQSNLQSLKTQQQNLQSRAAASERAGRPVPVEIVQQLNNLQDEEKSLKKTIQLYQNMRQDSLDSFAADRARIAELMQK